MRSLFRNMVESKSLQGSKSGRSRDFEEKTTCFCVAIISYFLIDLSPPPPKPQFSHACPPDHINDETDAMKRGIWTDRTLIGYFLGNTRTSFFRVQTFYRVFFCYDKKVNITPPSVSPRCAWHRGSPTSDIRTWPSSFGFCNVKKTAGSD